jgi:hypothetical protein
MMIEVSSRIVGSFRAMCFAMGFASFPHGILHRPFLLLGGDRERLIVLRDSVTRSNWGSIPHTSTNIMQMI